MIIKLNRKSANWSQLFRKLWLFRQLEHQNISIISKDIDSRIKKWEVGWGGRGVGGNPFDKEEN